MACSINGSTMARMPSRLLPLCCLSLAMLAGPAASAKDLPRGRDADTHSDACAMYGPGFRKVEGTDSCVKVGGQVRVEGDYNSSGASATPGVFARPH